MCNRRSHVGDDLWSPNEDIIVLVNEQTKHPSHELRASTECLIVCLLNVNRRLVSGLLLQVGHRLGGRRVRARRRRRGSPPRHEKTMQKSLAEAETEDEVDDDCGGDGETNEDLNYRA